MFFASLKARFSCNYCGTNLEIKHDDACRALYKIISWLLANPCTYFPEHIYVYKYVHKYYCVQETLFRLCRYMFTLVSWLNSYNAPTLVIILCLECVLKHIATKLYLPFSQPSLRDVNFIFTVCKHSKNEKGLTRLTEQFDSRGKNSSPSPEHTTVTCTD